MARIVDRKSFAKTFEHKQVDVDRIKHDRQLKKAVTEAGGSVGDLARADLNHDGRITGTKELKTLFKQVDRLERGGPANSFIASDDQGTALPAGKVFDRLALLAENKKAHVAAKDYPAPPQDYQRVKYDGHTVNERTRVMLERSEKFLGEMGYQKKIDLMQGSYHRGVSASAGTHDGGGAIDVNTKGLTHREIDKLVKSLRMAGFAAWSRDRSNGMVPHIHAIAIGDKEMVRGARSQVDAYFAGRSGLVGNAPDGNRDVGRPFPDWAKDYK